LCLSSAFLQIIIKKAGDAVEREGIITILAKVSFGLKVQGLIISASPLHDHTGK